MNRQANSDPIGPRDAQRTPRFAGPITFARLPSLDQVESADVAIVGIPFDSGTSYRPGARFGPEHVRSASRLLREFNPATGGEVFATRQIADAGDIACNPFDIEQAIDDVSLGIADVFRCAGSVVAIGGDHTITLPLLRAQKERYGPLGVIHFDAHLDTWDTYFGAAYTHGTPFRRASEEGLLDHGRCMHIGVRGPLYGRGDLEDDERLGFSRVSSSEFCDRHVDDLVQQVVDRMADAAAVYVSVDIDVLDPAHAPGTGTPEPGGLTSRELLGFLRGLGSLRVVGADLMEVAPAYDVADITAFAGAHVVYELLGLVRS